MASEGPDPDFGLEWTDTGSGHAYSLVRGRADRYQPGAPPCGPEDGVEYVYVGIIERHHRADTGAVCCGGVMWARLIEPSELEANRPIWQLVCLEPLHLEPSLLCRADLGGCGSHGWIRDGAWAEA